MKARTNRLRTLTGALLLLGFCLSPVVAAGQDIVAEVRALKASAAELAKRMDDLTRLVKEAPRQGPKGDKGEKGDRGEPGRPGEPGKGFAAKNIRITDNAIEMLGGTGIGATIRTGDNGHGLVRTWNRDLKETAYLGTASDTAGGIMTLHNKLGERKVELAGETKQGTPHILLAGKNIGDYAEVFERRADDSSVPGTVMCAVGDGLRVEACRRPRDSRVVGVISGAGSLNPAMLIGGASRENAGVAIALVGQVYVRATFEGGEIAPGDLLVASSQEGRAMRSAPDEARVGTVLGKALEAAGRVDAGEMLIRMLVMAR
jgi:hypothetical protein